MNRTQTNKQWYALYVIARHEKKIGLKMKEAGIECYVPLIKKMSQWSDRKKLVEVPLINGYVFVCVRNDEIEKPRYFQGVVNYVRENGKPAVIRSAEIEGLRYFVQNGFSLEEDEEEDLKIGDRVKFSLSEFRTFATVVEGFIGDRYAIVSFEGITKNYRLKAPIKALRKSLRGD